jgi:mono/diheme cytochrome c family protein
MSTRHTLRKGGRRPRGSGPRLLAAAALLLPGLLVMAGLGLWLLGRPARSQAAGEPATMAERSPASSSSARRAGMGEAEELFRQRCARCHEADGTGGSQRGNSSGIPDFSSHRWQAARSDAGLVASILEGKGTRMPAFRGKLSEPEARSLVARIRMFDPMPTSRPTAGTSGRTSADPPDDFEERFRRLDEELQALKKQLRELPAPAGKP